MKVKLSQFRRGLFCSSALGIGYFFSLAAGAQNSPDTAPAKTSQAIPWSQLGAKAGRYYQGDGLTIIPTAEGARLRCVFQRLEGEATPEGLWLTSTITDGTSDRFRLVASSVRRAKVGQSVPAVGREGEYYLNTEFSIPPDRRDALPYTLSHTGEVFLDGQTVRFSRPGLVEEYSASMAGVRQDFVVLERPAPSSDLQTPSPPLGEKVGVRGMPAGDSELRLELSVVGARVEQTAYGARLVLKNSGRKIAYSQLRVTDATGKELPARMQVQCGADFQICCVADWGIGDTAGLETCAPAAPAALLRTGTLVVVVEDVEAVYPVRIDPTFSDANWISAGIPGANAAIRAAVVDHSGNLYIGGNFTVVGNVIANYIARWNGSSWSALGSGMAGGDPYGPVVFALAVSGSDLYAGGVFTTAGGSAVNNIARWDGSSWSALGSGIAGGDLSGPVVYALAVSGGDLYAGGDFTTAGGSAANNIARWDGSSWSALGSGVGELTDRDRSVKALAVSGTDLYAGGDFRAPFGSATNYIAKWDGSSWSALGSGVNSSVYALAVSGSDLYAGGVFTTAGGSAANYIAKWDGSGWSALGEGMSSFVYALAVSDRDLYAGGFFYAAGGSAVKYIAKWNDSSWSPLGSGMGGIEPVFVFALAVSGGDLYAGGYFTTAGGKASANIARAFLLPLPRLSVLRSGPDEVKVSWPSADTAGFALEHSGALAAPSWFTNSARVTDDGTNKSVTIPPTNSAQFFRLRGL